MHSLESVQKNLPLIEERIGYVFDNKELLILSLVHRSYVNEHKDEILNHNERLEFLGDSVLGLIMSDFLYHRLPDLPEGSLSQFRSSLVDANACASSIQKVGIQEFILLGRGEARREGDPKVSILADAFEALIGAIYLDGGLDSAKVFITSHFTQEIETVIESPSRNYKAELQDYSQKKYKVAPQYNVVQETGPDHAKTFHVMVYVNEKEMGLGVGDSKKQAEQKAALEALSKVEDHDKD